MKSDTAKYIQVTTPQGQSGSLLRDGGDYLFQYDPRAPREAEIALTMEMRATQFRSQTLFPIFEMNLPEGYVLEQLQHRFAKTTSMDPMLLLTLTGSQAAVGRVSAHSASSPATGNEVGVKLETILAWNGAEDLFRALSERYLTRTGMSGVQPKVLVPEELPATVYGKASMAMSDLIVKSAGEDFPGLAVNEFICMSIAREAGVPVPEFYLSENRKLFVVRRFDRTPAGEAVGFEDMAALMGKATRDKYKGSYGQIARAIDLFCAPEYKVAAKAQLFDQVALSVMLGNGDAHLKNFGLLYTHPLANDMRMAPAYDIVNTTRYIPEDALALTLNGSRSLMVARVDIREFGEQCGVADPSARMGQLIEAAETILFLHQDLLDDDPEILTALRQGVDQFTRAHEHIASTSP